jgi:hypothetical protein
MISFLRSQLRADDVREPYILHRRVAFRFMPDRGFSSGEPTKPSPKLVSTIHDSVQLARMVMEKVQGRG